MQLRIRDKYEERRDCAFEVRSIRRQLDESDRQAANNGKPVSEEASSIRKKISDAENEIVSFRPTVPQPRGVPIGPLADLKELMGIVTGADWRPTASSYEFFDDPEVGLQDQFEVRQDVVEEDLPAFTALLSELGIPTISSG